jgi:hypothetical protein
MLMDIMDALADARIALRRVQKLRALTILAKYPDYQSACLMMDKMLGADSPVPCIMDWPLL